MNFELSDEQLFLREAARGVLGRVKSFEAARGALEGEPLPDLWPAAREAGWPGLVVDEAAGGAGLGALDAMLVMAECGRALASVPLLGHVPASALVSAARGDGAEVAALAERLASGEARAALVPARPPGDLESAWTVDPREGRGRGAAPAAAGGGGTGVRVQTLPSKRAFGRSCRSESIGSTLNGSGSYSI